MKLLVLNGPNVNMLGYSSSSREGDLTLTALEKGLATYGVQRYDDLELVFFQTNHEGQLIDMLQKASVSYDGVIFNPSSLCHTSYALRDAIKLQEVPVAEVHLYDISEFEAVRGPSLITEVCSSQFAGKGLDSYKEALDFLLQV